MTGQTKNLGEVCEVFTDGNWIESKDQSANGIRLIQTGNIGEGFFKDRGEKARYISEETFKRLKCTEIFAGDILISRLPDPVGRACILSETGEKMITAVDCSILRLKLNTSPEFFNYYTQSNSYLNDVERMTTGTTRKRISRKKLGLVQIPLPPLPEQKRIVKILDDTFAVAERAREIAEQNLANAKELFESYLQSVFVSGGDDWEERTLEEISTIINGHSFSSKHFSPKNQIKSIKITNVGVRQFIEESENYLPVSFANDFKEYQIKEGNIVLALTRTIISSGLKVAVVPGGYSGALLNQRVAAIVANEKVVNPSFLYSFLCTDIVKKYVLSKVNTLMQPNLSINDLRKLLVPLPSINEQKTIVKKLDRLSAETKKLERIYQQKLDNLAELKKSILAKAFAGEL